MPVCVSVLFYGTSAISYLPISLIFWPSYHSHLAINFKLQFLSS